MISSEKVTLSPEPANVTGRSTGLRQVQMHRPHGRKVAEAGGRAWTSPPKTKARTEHWIVLPARAHVSPWALAGPDVSVLQGGGDKAGALLRKPCHHQAAGLDMICFHFLDRL